MKPRLKATRAARELIKAYEPFAPEAVRRGRRWVVGYGHTAAAKPGVTVARDDAELLLIYDVAQAETAVKNAVGEDMPAAARDALISFAASLGANAFKVSDVARLAAAGRHEDAARAMESWVRAEQDGRLVISERLQQRRRAERTLYLEGLSGAQAAAPGDDEPRLGALVDVDIAFEDPTPPQPDAAPAPDPEAPSQSIDAEPDAAPDALDGQAEPEPEPAPEAESEREPVSAPHADAATAPDAADDHPDAVRRAEQDAAIQAVMARMAGEIAASIGAPPAEADPAIEAGRQAPQADLAPRGEFPAPDLTKVRLGFSYLTPSRVDAASEGQGGSAPDLSVEPAAATMPGPVYATVSVEPYTPAPVAASNHAPPHPGEAPARAGGLSGESEGPDHAGDEDGGEIGEDDSELEPAIVAGPEAPVDSEEAPAPTGGRGDWVYGANLAVGLGLAGFGGWELVSNLESYLAAGLDFSLVGPVAFGAGVLLTAASGWYVVGALRRKG